MRTLTFMALLVVTLSSCTHSPRGTERVPARLLLGNDTAQIALPTTVNRGQSFTVTVTTFAGGCRQRSAGTEASVRGSLAVVRPYHLLQRSGACTDDLLRIPHTAQLRFDQPGTATVQFSGAANRLDFGEELRPVTIQRVIRVR
jgi:hypothetical protein